MYSAKILADSIAPCGKRLTTFEITYPRFVHSEFMTHRMISKNSASSRAIPNDRLRAVVLEDPAGPVFWGANQKGMQAAEELTGEALKGVQDIWIQARDAALEFSKKLAQTGLHKQITNRILEPWMWITVIASATDWANFFHLRCRPDAQPEHRKIAEMMHKIYKEHEPVEIDAGGWHRPLIEVNDICDVDADCESLNMVSAGRCARVSYLAHGGCRSIGDDIALANRLIESGHWSPFEHVAQALPSAERHGNFTGWKQFRKFCANENVEG